MNVQMKTMGYQLSAFDQDRLDKVVAHLDHLVSTYEMRHLQVTVERGVRTNDVEVRMTLALGRRRLVARERAPIAATAFQQCADVLSKRIELAKSRVHKGHGERAVRRAKAEAALPDMEALRRAVAERDFEAFNDALADAPGALEQEAARRLKHHPAADAFLGDEFFLSDVVETAIHRVYDRWGDGSSVPLHDRVVQEIDPAIEEIVQHLRAA